MPSATTDKYIVISLEDVEEYFSLIRKMDFFELLDYLNLARESDGKPPLSNIVDVVEKQEVVNDGY